CSDRILSEVLSVQIGSYLIKFYMDEIQIEFSYLKSYLFVSLGTASEAEPTHVMITLNIIFSQPDSRKRSYFCIPILLHSLRVFLLQQFLLRDATVIWTLMH